MTRTTTLTPSTNPSPARRALRRPLLVLATAAVALPALLPLGGCALAIGGAALSVPMLLTDRRTSGTQVEDEGIEFKALARVREAAGDRGHVNVTSYNRLVLVTGEVPAEADREAVGKAVGRIENVASVVNELAVAGNSSIGNRSNDALITSRVKASYVDAKDLQANAIKVVTERSVVFLMGRVTEREAARAAEIARSVTGVQKVVRVFEMLTEEDLAKLR